jgi:hypothetical protein
MYYTRVDSGWSDIRTVVKRCNTRLWQSGYIVRRGYWSVFSFAGIGPLKIVCLLSMVCLRASRTRFWRRSCRSSPTRRRWAHALIHLLIDIDMYIYVYQYYIDMYVYIYIDFITDKAQVGPCTDPHIKYIYIYIYIYIIYILYIIIYMYMYIYIYILASSPTRRRWAHPLRHLLIDIVEKIICTYWYAYIYVFIWFGLNGIHVSDAYSSIYIVSASLLYLFRERDCVCVSVW